jgi:hypothetical protein
VLYLLAGTTSPDATNPLVSYGLLGVILVAFTYLILSGRLVSGKEHDRVIAEKAELQRTTPDAITALVASAETTKEATSVMREVLRTLDRRGGSGP